MFADAPSAAATLTMYRCVEASRSPADASRSATYAGRWHHPAESLALYAADDPDLSIAEWAGHVRPGVQEADVSIGHLSIVGARVVRLADVAAHLRWPVGHLLDDGVGYMRAILVGTAACRAGVDVLLVPSAANPARLCAVCYMRHRPRIGVVAVRQQHIVLPYPPA